MGILETIILIVFLMFVSAFFSMAEISLAGSRKIKLQLLAEEGNNKAKKIIDLQNNPGNFFTTVQIGLNIVAILAGIVGDGILSPFLNNYITNPTVVFLLSFFFITSLFIEFADLIPKRLAMVHPEKVALVLVNPMIFIITLLSPVVWFFSSGANLVFKIFKIPISREDSITYEDVSAVICAGAEAGVVHTKEHHLIENVFELDQRWISSVMTLRDSIVYFTLDESEESIKEKIIEFPHSKFLICHDEIDSIYGYVNSRDILPRILKGEESGLNNIEEIANKNILIVPNTLTLSEMLDKFRDSHEDFAIILNEYAYVVGIITLNDVISTVMGHIVYSDQDDYIIQREDNSWLIDGVSAIEDIKKVLDIAIFPEEDAYDTIAGFMIYMLKSIPKKGAIVNYSGYSFEVVDVDNFKIDQLLVVKLKVDNLSKKEDKDSFSATF